MKNQKYRRSSQSHSLSRYRHGFFTALRPLILVGVLVGSVVGIQSALAAQTISDYCNTKYKDSAESVKNACKAGITGQEDCSDYALLFDEATSQVCYTEASDHPSDLVTSTPSPSPSPTPTPSPDTEDDDSDSNFDFEQLQSILDQTKSLSDYIDVLHEAGPDADVDTSEEVSNNRDSYVNGAGKQQKIEILAEGTGKSPAILFFNGGGWHMNDQMGQNVAGIDTPLYNNAGVERAQDRGYALFDVTYRLGSSGVYYMFEDVMRGVEHIRKNADLYGIDPNKIAVWGDSAGGSLSMRVAASGKSGAKAAIGWSAPTNAYTAVFRSIYSFAIGVDHSTCAPTDLAGFANFADLAAGGSGDVAEYGQGLSSNDVSALGLDLSNPSLEGLGGADPLALLTQGMIAGKNLLSTAKDIETISEQIKSDPQGGLSATTMNLASKKFVECLDNFNVLSPALFASPESSPSFLGGFENDGLVGPDQAYGMRDKLRQLGIQSDAMILPGSDECRKDAADFGGGGCHLGYFKDFVCPSLNFLDSIIQPERGQTNCETGVAENAGTEVANANTGNTGGSSGGSGNNGSSGTNSGGGGGGSGQTSGNTGTNTSSGGQPQAACDSEGYQVPGVTGVCPKGQRPAANNNSSGGNFNPNIKIDTSTTTVSKDPCDGRGGFMMGPNGAKAGPPPNGVTYPNNGGYKYVCYGAEW